MRLKKFNQINENKEQVNGISVYKIWVVQIYPGDDIQTIYTNHEDAVNESVRLKMEFYDHYRGINKQMSDDEFEEYFGNEYKNKFKIVDLDTAIDDIRDSIRDDIASNNEPGY